jgi:biotin carboxyl carrier protein
MKLKTQIGEASHEITLNLASDRAVVEVDEHSYDLEIRELAPGEYLLVNGSSVFKCRVEAKHDRASTGELFEVMLRGRHYDVSVIDPKRLRSTQTAGAHHHGAAEIVSPMPGKIVRVLVESGAPVEAGAGIIVVEAMKMQNEMKAPKAGTVVSINVAEGATVNAGDVLAVIE